MGNGQFDTPILLIMFNRPDHAKQVFERIRSIRPKDLYIAVDGPRENHPTDRDRVAKCLDLLEGIDWDCNVHKLIRAKNLGCGKAVSSAITWFFDQVEMGIILEDDCLPDATFFTYCQELLATYKNDESVMHIGGVNYQDGALRGDGSYYFTKVCHIWGWATWRRAWQKYDFSIKNFDRFKETGAISNVLSHSEDQNYWLKAFESVYTHKVDTWDYQWVYTVWSHNGLCILPNHNLVSNIGFDEFATHTTSRNLLHSDKAVTPLTTIIHPTFRLEDKAATEYSFKTLFRTKSEWNKKVDRMKLRLRYRTWHI